MKLTLLLLLVVGLVSCNSIERLGGESAGDSPESLHVKQEGSSHALRGCFGRKCGQKGDSLSELEPYLPAELNWNVNPTYQSPRISQERNNKGFFAKLKSKFSRKRKERKNDEQGGKHKNTRKRNRHEYAFNNDDNDSGYGNEDAQDELEEDEMDDANNAKRYTLAELERALRNTVLLSSHLNLDVGQNKTSPSVETVLKEVDENQQIQDGGKGENTPLGEENDAQVGDIIVNEGPIEENEKNEETDTLVQENNSDKDEDDIDDDDI